MLRTRGIVRRMSSESETDVHVGNVGQGVNALQGGRSMPSSQTTFGLVLILLAGFQVSPNAGEIKGLADKCMDVANANNADGTSVNLFRCHSGLNQNWKITKEGEIRVFDNKCLDIRGGALHPQSGTPIQIFTCHGGPNQKWSIQNGEIQGLDNLCLDIRGAVAQDGQPLQVYSCHGGPNQLWRFVGKPISIALYISGITCQIITDTGPGNDRDEVFILSDGATSSGHPSERLPRRSDNDDYYEFVRFKEAKLSLLDWTNRDQAPVAEPMLWSGTLNHGDSIAYNVTLMEQDNKDAGPIKDVVKAVLTGLSGLDSVVSADKDKKEIYTNAISVASKLADLLPDNTTDDVIGAFSVTLTNNDGQLQSTWLPISNVTIRQGETGSTTTMNETDPVVVHNHLSGIDSANFEMNATGGGKYNVTVNAEIHSPSQNSAKWTYLGRLGGVHPVEGLVSDRCNRPQIVTVRNSAGTYVEVTDNGVAIPISGGSIYWRCAASNEGPATCQPDSNLVIAQKAHGDVLRWYCFRQDPF